MLGHIADFTAWPILTGILVGYVANRLMSGEGKGCCMNLFVGIIGSYAGSFIRRYGRKSSSISRPIVSSAEPYSGP